MLSLFFEENQHINTSKRKRKYDKRKKKQQIKKTKEKKGKRGKKIDK